MLVEEKEDTETEPIVSTREYSLFDLVYIEKKKIYAASFFCVFSIDTKTFVFLIYNPNL
jgi:hypothetical protein